MNRTVQFLLLFLAINANSCQKPNCKDWTSETWYASLAEWEESFQDGIEFTRQNLQSNTGHSAYISFKFEDDSHGKLLSISKTESSFPKEEEWDNDSINFLGGSAQSSLKVHYGISECKLYLQAIENGADYEIKPSSKGISLMPIKGHEKLITEF